MSFLAQAYYLIKTPVVFFTASRYLHYALLVVRGVIIAKFLGPYYFGIWGFIRLMQQYLSYTNLGIHYALSTGLSTRDQGKQEDVDRIIQSAITVSATIGMALVLLGLGLSFLGTTLFDTYGFDRFVVAIVIIIALTNLEQVLANAYRVYGKLGRIAISELLNAALPLAAVFIVPEELIINAVLVAMIAAGLMNNLIFMIRAPFKVGLAFQRSGVTYLIRLGIPLLLYNVSNYMIMVVSLTIISIFYSVEILGFYSLGNSIANAVFLGLHAISWVFYPLVLSKVREGRDDIEVGETIQKVMRLYSTAVFLVVFLTSIFIPLLFLYLEDFTPVQPVLHILLISVAIRNLPLAYASVGIARGKQLTIALLNAIAISTVILLGLAAVYFRLQFTWIAVATLAGASLSMVLKAYFGSQLINLPMRIFWTFLPAGTIFSLLLSLLGNVLGQPTLFSIIALSVFVLTNRDNIRHIWVFTRTFSAEKRRINVIG